MNSKTYLIILLLIISILVINNLLVITLHPIHSVIDLSLLAGVIVLSILYGEKKKKETYDYDMENPNALTCGKNIAGTVYASYPENVPGLGWI